MACSYILVGVLFFVLIGNAALNGKVDLQFFADSLTYASAAEEWRFGDFYSLVGVNKNYLGPVLIFRALFMEHWAVLVFNAGLFLISLALLGKNNLVDRRVLVFTLALSPITFSSLLSINKEILSLFVVALLICNISRKSFAITLFAIVVSFFVRWQMTVFVFALVLLDSRINPVFKSRWLTLIGALAGLSIVYPLTLSLFSHTDAVAALGAAESEGSGLYSMMIKIQNMGGYFIVFIPKVLQSMFGLAAKVGNIDSLGFYNSIVVGLHSVVAFLLFLFLLVLRRFSLQNDAIFMAMLYCAIFGLSPIYAPRYYYPAFVMMCFALSMRRRSGHIKFRDSDSNVKCR